MVLTLLALIPPLYLMYKIYKQDKVESEPIPLLVRVFILGALTIIPVMAAEIFMENFFLTLIDSSNTFQYILVDNIVCVALVEEFFKYLAAKSIWKSKEFNYRFDGIVYCATSALGFAALENLLYVLENGFSTAVMRAVLSVPSHCIDGIFMGIYFGEAKHCESLGDQAGKRRNLFMGLTIATFTHGIYDALLSFNHDLYFLIFLVYVIIVDVIALRKIKKHSQNDCAI